MAYKICPCGCGGRYCCEKRRSLLRAKMTNKHKAARNWRRGWSRDK